MTDKKTIDLNIIELTNLAANILNQIFIKNPKDKSKAVFKEIKQGKAYPLGTISFQDLYKPKLTLTLDYSEFCGPGFNFDVFQVSLKGILTQISQKFQAKADLNILNSEEGSLLIHLPGLTQRDGQLNAMLMAFDIGNLNNITISLMFVDPSQYEKLKK